MFELPSQVSKKRITPPTPGTQNYRAVEEIAKPLHRAEVRAEARESEKRKQFGWRSASAGTAVDVTITHDLSPSMLVGGVRK